jgi:hypothetical protein
VRYAVELIDAGLDGWGNVTLTLSLLDPATGTAETGAVYDKQAVTSGELVLALDDPMNIPEGQNRIVQYGAMLSLSLTHTHYVSLSLTHTLCVSVNLRVCFSSSGASALLFFFFRF